MLSDWLKNLATVFQPKRLGFFYKVELRIRSKISVKERVWLIAKYFRETIFLFEATTIVNEGA